MIELPYSLVIEASEDPERFGFYAPGLKDFGGFGHSIEDCIYRARWGMREHVEWMAEQGMPIPPSDSDPTITICNAKRAAAAA